MATNQQPRPCVLIADGQELTLNGLVHLLGMTYEVAEAKNAPELVMRLKKTPGLLVIDYNTLTDFSADALIELHQSSESLPIMVVTASHDRRVILKILESGIHGFLYKDCSAQELLHCADALLRGERYFCDEVFDILMESRVAKPGSEHWPSHLTTREVDIIRLIVKGHSTPVIAGELNLSPHTISTHRKNISRKLKIKSSVELAAQAFDLGLIERP